MNTPKNLVAALTQAYWTGAKKVHNPAVMLEGDSAYYGSGLNGDPVIFDAQFTDRFDSEEDARCQAESFASEIWNEFKA